MEGKPIDPSNESIEVGAGPGGVDVSARALAKSTLASIKEGSHAGGCPGTRRGLIRQDPRLPVAQIAITIDTECPDHPARDPIATCEELLDILRSSRVPATFFIVGSWARAYPTLVQWIAGQGHLIGAHGYAHCNLEKMTDDGIVTSIGTPAGVTGIPTSPQKTSLRAPWPRSKLTAGRRRSCCFTPGPIAPRQL